jgi:predicted alpha/beta-hydrolase family hydrolase
MSAVEAVQHQPAAGPAVRGFLHRPQAESNRAVVLAHGAGSNATAPILVNACAFFAAAGFLALRIDLPFRQLRAGGSPHPSKSAQDREGIANAVAYVRDLGAQTVVLGGHSYGGRQATMLASEQPAVADLLLLFSYPLHPPDKPAQLRTAHLPNLQVPCLFAHGAKDPFGTIQEMDAALSLIPAAHRLIEVAGAGHDLRKLPLDNVLSNLLGMLPSGK